MGKRFCRCTSSRCLIWSFLIWLCCVWVDTRWCKLFGLMIHWFLLWWSVLVERSMMWWSCCVLVSTIIFKSWCVLVSWCAVFEWCWTVHDSRCLPGGGVPLKSSQSPHLSAVRRSWARFLVFCWFKRGCMSLIMYRWWWIYDRLWCSCARIWRRGCLCCWFLNLLLVCGYSFRKILICLVIKWFGCLSGVLILCVVLSWWLICYFIVVHVWLAIWRMLWFVWAIEWLSMKYKFCFIENILKRSIQFCGRCSRSCGIVFCLWWFWFGSWYVCSVWVIWRMCIWWCCFTMWVKLFCCGTLELIWMVVSSWMLTIWGSWNGFLWNIMG